MQPARFSKRVKNAWANNLHNFGGVGLGDWMDERAAEVAEVVEFVVFHPQDKGEQNLMAQSGRHIVDPEASCI